MQLQDIVKEADAKLSIDCPAIQIQGIRLDSRKVKKGDLFFALPGSQLDGTKFVPEALKRGASAVVLEKPTPLTNVPQLVVKDARIALAKIAKAFYNKPDLLLDLGAVTGTNGKTTTAWFVRHIFNNSGTRCGLLGTIEYDDGNEVIPAPMTTPDAPELFHALRKMVTNGCRKAFMETSSHSLVQKRSEGLHFKTAVFTNLTQDHLDYHRTPEEYRSAKGILFEQLSPKSFAVLNADDPTSDWYAQLTSAEVLRFSVQDRADIYSKIVSHNLYETTFEIHSPWGSSEITWNIFGLHNISNALGALAAAVSMGADFKTACRALQSCKGIPGRLESIFPSDPNSPKPQFQVLVDYAHTPDALRAVLESIRSANPNRLIVVYGCGGDRDRTKRPLMGRAVEEQADLSVLTSDNPRTEDPEGIIADVLEGIQKPENISVEPDRAAAIQLAVREARADDVVVIAGKGHETYQIIGKEKLPFDDREFAQKALDSLI